MVLDLGMYDEEIDTKGKARRQQLKYPIRGQGQGLGSSYPDWVGSGLVVVKVGWIWSRGRVYYYLLWFISLTYT